MFVLEIRKGGSIVDVRVVNADEARRGCNVAVNGSRVVVRVGQVVKLDDQEISLIEKPAGPPAGAANSDAADLPSMSMMTLSGDRRPVSDAAPPQLEGYTLHERIGEGGMGAVWRGEQLSTRRAVAVKVMGLGAFGSARAQRRFEREVELSARLEHPNIARIYDSGLCQGVYYYAMELIQGVPLNVYVRQQALDHRQIVELFIIVCHAVQHAHQRGVIHRDLKPSNILVDRDGRPHVLDFGLAKSLLLQYAGDDAPDVTMEGDLAGTPAFMSPEQAAGRHDKLDVRSDVYALGVILYGLLVGRGPHDLTGGVIEVLKRVAEQDPLPPRRACRDIDRELETVLLKALARETDRRYASAGQFADDLRRWLDGEPLIARPPTLSYFAMRRLKKHRLPVAAVLGFLATLITLAGWSYVRIVRERNRAEEATRTTQAALEQTRREVYFASLAYARECLLGSAPRPALARQALLQCPADLRHFEWRFLHACVENQGIAHELDRWTQANTGDRFSVSNDGRALAFLGRKGLAEELVVVRRDESGWSERAIPLEETAMSVRVDPQGKLVALGSPRRILDLATLEDRCVLPREESDEMSVSDLQSDLVCLSSPNAGQRAGRSHFYGLDGALRFAFDGMTPCPSSCDQWLLLMEKSAPAERYRFHLADRSGRIAWTLPEEFGPGLVKGVLSPSGRSIAIVDRETVHVYDVATRIKRDSWEAVAAQPNAVLVLLSNDDSMLLLANRGRWPRTSLYRLADWKLIWSHGKATARAAFSSDSRRLAVADGNLVHVVAASTGDVETTIRGHDTLVEEVAFTADNRQLISVSTSRLIETTLRAPERASLRGLYGPTGRFYACDGDSLTIHEPDERSPGTVHATISAGLSLSADSKTILWQGRDAAIFWDDAGRRLGAIPLDPISRANLRPQVEICGSGAYMLFRHSPVRDGKSSIGLFDLRKNRQVWSVEATALPLSAMARRVSVDDQMWDAGGAFSVTNPDRAPAALTAMRSARLFRTMAVENEQDRWNIRDRATGRTLHSLPRGTRHLWSESHVAVDAAERMVALSIEEDRVDVTDLKTGIAMATVRGGHSRTIKALCLSESGQRLATLDDLGVVTLWDPSSGREITYLQTPIRPENMQCWMRFTEGDTLLHVYDHLDHQILISAGR